MHTFAANATTRRPLITCVCRPPDHCPNHTVGVCRTNRQCYFHRSRDPKTGKVTESLGCYSNDKDHHLLYCRTKKISNHAIACCESEMCNERLNPQFPATQPPDRESDEGINLRKPMILGSARVDFAMAIVIPSLVLVILAFLMFLLWRIILKPRLKEYALKASNGAGKAKSACASVSGRDLLLPSVNNGHTNFVATSGGPVDGSSSLRAQHVGESTLHRLYDISCSSGSGSGLPFLVQRTVARQVSLVECIGKGRYGEVWRGDYHGEPVAVKIFSSREEASWFRETEMYNTLLLRHENILGYFASDMTSRYGCTQLWLITHYHPYGSLFDYLNAHVVSPEAGLSLIYSAAAGLCHLHTEIFGCQGKPGIAHRDVKSKNILVRVNGSCCIADLGLSVTYSQASDELNMGRANSSFPVQLPNNKVGTKRYMSPEILTEAHCAPTLSKAAAFELLKAADVYALALVMWEVLRRCVTDGVMDEYLIPFAGRVPADPTYEQMKTVVCDRKERPPLSARWEEHPGLSRVCKLLSEGWHAEADVRVSSLRMKKTMGRILDITRAARRMQESDVGVESSQGFCESSCEDASLSQSSTSLLHSVKPSAPPPLLHTTESGGPSTEETSTLVPEGEMKLLLSHEGTGIVRRVENDGGKLLSSSGESTNDKTAIFEQLMV